VQQADFHARQFQSRTGRFLLSDPVFGGAYIPEQWNRYAYGKNNPLRFTDYGGLWVDGFGCSHTGITKRHIDEVTCPPTGGGSGGSFMAAPIVVDAGWSGTNPGLGLGRNGGGVGGRGPRTGGANTGDGAVNDVTNNGTNTIYVKEEHTDAVHPVKPGETWVGNQDGIADPCDHPGEVFKSTDYTDVSFSPTVTVAQPPVWTGGVPPAALFVEGVQLIRGGWQGESFHSHHHDWDKLFDAANRGTSGCSGRK